MHPFLRLELEDVSAVIGLWGKSIGMYMVVDGYERAGSRPCGWELGLVRKLISICGGQFVPRFRREGARLLSPSAVTSLSTTRQ